MGAMVAGIIAVASVVGGVFAAIDLALVELFILSVQAMRDVDLNADASIDQYIPIDAVNCAFILNGPLWYCRTPHFWWWGKLTWIGVLGPA